MTPPIRRRPFGKTPDGGTVDLFTLGGPGGVEASVMTYGAALQALLAPDRDGHCENVGLGFATLDGYVENTGHFFGATVGRYANRIAGARFALDGIVHEVDRNDGQSCLHGGARGFDTRVWDVVEAADGMLRLAYSSPDGEMGFPGKLDVRVEYRLEGTELRIDYEAATSAPTVVNLTNHTCWNLAGEGSGSVEGHVLTLNASAFTPVDANLVPNGEIRPVDGTPLDFRVPTPIGARGCGFDHNVVVDRRDDSLVLAARVLEPASGRTLDVLTTEPGLQLYTGTFLDGSLVGTSGRPYRRGDCIALETQHFPDSPNRPAFPSTVLRPGETFRSTTVFRFGCGNQGDRGGARPRR
ncbi:MAG: aldose epimerase family protein [Gaiellaceae bacterium]